MTKMKNSKKRIYQVPVLDVCQVRIELGFAVTGSTIEQVGGRNEEQEW